MPSCALRYCKTRYGLTNGPGIGLFSFPPRNLETCKIWTRFVQTERKEENWRPSTASKLCSKHFREEDVYFGKRGRTHLKRGSIPQIPSYCCVDEETNPKCCTSHTTQVNGSDTETVFDTSNKESLNTEVHQPEGQAEKEESEIKKLSPKSRCSKLKILNLKDFVKHLEKKFGIQKNISNALKAIVETQALRETLSQKLKLTHRKFSPPFRKFALSLHLYCPAAYKYARKCFRGVFPHIRTLRKWYVNVSAQPGFTEESLQALKLKRIETGKELICSLVFGDISMRRQKVWNIKKNEGYVNLGFGDMKDEQASAALVFMVVSLDQKWKIPVGYFFVHSITAYYTAILVKQCLGLCHEVGVKIVSMTFDAESKNLLIAEMLGCKLTSDPENLKTDFPHPITQERIVIFLEPSHMMKLVRNTFETKKVFYDKENEKIKWSLMVSLCKLQRNEQLLFPDRLSNKHIHFRNQLINAQLSTQSLSYNSAKALLLCHVLLRGQTFENVSATVKFITIINDLFFIMKSNKYGMYDFKQPLTTKNISSVLTFLENSKNYILSLNQYIKFKQKRNHRNLTNKKIIITKPLVDNDNETGLLGFLINIQSLRSLVEDVVNTNKIKYLSTNRLSHDHLELFFRCIRRHVGPNDEPNVKQFKATYKKIVANLELRDSFSENCAPMDNFAAPTCSSIETINSTCLLAEIDEGGGPAEKEFNTDFIARQNCEILNMMLGKTPLAVESKQIIGYISGYVSCTLSKKIKCDICVSSLVANKKLDFHKLIFIRDMGGLCFSSKSVFDVCKATERVIKKLINETGGKDLYGSHIVDYIKTKVLKVFLNSNIFDSLSIHSFESPAILNHRLHIIRSVIETYANIKLCNVSKFKSGLHNKSKIIKSGKLILF